MSSPHGRVLVTVPEAELEEALARVSRVFGLVSVSPTLTVPPDLTANFTLIFSTWVREIRRC